MTTRRSLIWFTIAATALIALVLWRCRKQPAETPPLTTVKPNSQPVFVTNMLANTLVRTNTSLTHFVNQTAALSKPQDKGRQMKAGLAEMNDVPIVFYGKLEDQFGGPVVGAQISASVRIYNGVQSTLKHLKTESNGAGFFQIQGGKGEGLGLWPQKDGYVLATTATYFKYSYMYPDHFEPDSNKPTVIKMWRLRGAEPLVGFNKEYRVPFASDPIYFDLIAGEVVQIGGDLEICITRATGSLSKRNTADWSIDIRPINGGIMESDSSTSNVTTYEAPQSGYQGNYLVQMKHGDPTWRDCFGRVFFLKSRDGRVYSKFKFDFGINAEPNDHLWFHFRGVANTNFSRNWEASALQEQ